VGEKANGFSWGEGKGEGRAREREGQWESSEGAPGASVPMGDAGWEPWHLLPSMMDDMPSARWVPHKSSVGQWVTSCASTGLLL